MRNCNGCIHKYYYNLEIDFDNPVFDGPCRCCGATDIKTFQLVETMAAEKQRVGHGTSLDDDPDTITFTKRPTNRWMRLDTVAPGALVETPGGMRVVKSRKRKELDGHHRWACTEVGSGIMYWLKDETKVKVLTCEEDDLPF
ncbi:MAG: hypothetical protein ACXABD_20500 [Candidatus Thorarchaeota archaeon]|jgi:hypothetical protein